MAPLLRTAATRPVPSLLVPELFELLACPRCGRDVHEADENVWCDACGVVGRRRLGHLDFTAARSLPAAAGGAFDLLEDETLAHRVVHQAGPTFEDGLAFVLPRKAWLSGGDCCQQRAVQRAAARYDLVEQQAGDRHGKAILDKVHAALDADGRTFANGTALEAGGGLGKYLFGFRQRFAAVVFVDCSLTNIVLAERLATEQGLDGVTFVRADVEALPFRDGSFAFVHQNGVIEHVAHPIDMVREALRVTEPGGTYACLSPNRFPVTKEPHFEVRLFGIFPPTIRRRVIRHTRGVESEAGTDLRSLRELKAIFRAAGVPAPNPFFLPPRLPSIARSTPLRRLLKRLLDNDIANRGIRGILNHVLLPVAPYHLVVTTR